MVALGTLMSATWILAVNSWMQTPAGYSINEVGQFVPENWFEIVFNPSFPYRLVHMVLAAFLTTALAIGAVGAWHLLKDSTNKPARLMFSMTMWMLITVAPLQILAGDEHGINTLEYQPAKIAAMEGHYQTEEGGTPLIIFGFPNDETERVDYAVKIPYLGSLILTRSLTGSFAGLTEFPKEDRPPSLIVFWTFRIMVAIGFAMLGLGMWGVLKRWRGTMYKSAWLQKASILMGPMGFVAVLAGWVTTEVGRQPWTVYGLLRTVDSAGPLEASAVGTSLLVFIVVYFTLFGAGTVYILRLMGQNPDEGNDIHDLGPTRAAGITPGLATTLSNEEPKNDI
ncbi:MAG: cytochrome ubiquinol oxidase subunit I, partial [Rhodobacterales bacterium]